MVGADEKGMDYHVVKDIFVETMSWTDICFTKPQTNTELLSQI